LEDSGGWFVLPDGTLPELGDTEPVAAATWARKASEGKFGLQLFREAGFAIVKEASSYLIVAAGYHGHGHKQADELTFVLYEMGCRVLGDTGRYGYYETDPARIYARSSYAHNVLIVDRMSFDWRKAKPYGSGLVAAGEGDGWFAIEASNPLLRIAEVDHRRLFLYRPLFALIVIDQVFSDQEHCYTRMIHFGKDIDVVVPDGPLLIAGNEFQGMVTDWGESAVSRRLFRGQKAPELRGWTFPRDRQWQEIATVEYESRDSRAVYAIAIFLQRQTKLVSASVNHQTWEVRLDINGSICDLECGVDGERLIVIDRCHSVQGDVKG
jgi:hypothetical protein